MRISSSAAEACCRTWNSSNTASAPGNTSVTTLRYGQCMSTQTASTAARWRASIPWRQSVVEVIARVGYLVDGILEAWRSRRFRLLGSTSSRPARSFEYIQALWDHFSEHPEEVPIPDWHRQVVAERLAAHRRGELTSRPWSDNREEILSRLRSAQ